MSVLQLAEPSDAKDPPILPRVGDGTCAADECGDAVYHRDPNNAGPQALQGGHLVPLRSLGTSLGHVEIRHTLPSPREVAEQYFNPAGTPVLLRGATKYILLNSKMEDWTDEYLARCVELQHSIYMNRLLYFQRHLHMSFALDTTHYIITLNGASRLQRLPPVAFCAPATPVISNVGLPFVVLGSPYLCAPGTRISVPWLTQSACVGRRDILLLQSVFGCEGDSRGGTDRDSGS